MSRTSPVNACLLLLATMALGLAGCMRGGISSEPPVHLVLDMDFQQKLRTQAEAHFEGWSDKRASRLPVSDAFGRQIVVAQNTLPNAALAHKDAAG